MTVVVSGAPPPRKSGIWTPQRTLALTRLVEQCGANLCRVIMAQDLGLGANGAYKVNKKLRELGIESRPI